jgi:ureidoacrylate peracid hydrolase
MSKSALLVIDVQNIYINPESDLYCQQAEQTVSKINRLIKHFEKLEQPIFYIQHVHKTDGSDTGHMFDFAGEVEGFNFKENSDETSFSSDLYIQPNHTVLTKNRYSSFLNTNLDSYLKENDVERVVICGFMTNFCCESAARDAHDRDYYVDFILDATGTPGVDGFDQDQTRQAVAAFLSAGFATLFSTNDYLP